MSESTHDSKGSSDIGITDDQLPEDLVPSEDNPLAEGLPAGETAETAPSEVKGGAGGGAAGGAAGGAGDGEDEQADAEDQSDD